MPRKESKFYVINFKNKIFKNKILTPRAMKTHIKIRITKESRKERNVCKDYEWIRTILLLMLRYIDFS